VYQLGITEQLWTYLVGQIARESEHREGVLDLSSPLGPVDAG
jgi:hypothetical protein